MSSDCHLDFGQDHIPVAERHSEHASTSFDWESVYRNLDGELDTLREDLDEANFRKLERSLTAVVVWTLNTRDNAGHGLDAAVGRRMLYLATALFPRVLGKTRQELCNELRISKQALSDQIGDAKRFLRGLRV